MGWYAVCACGISWTYSLFKSVYIFLYMKLEGSGLSIYSLKSGFKPFLVSHPKYTCIFVMRLILVYGCITVEKK